MYYKAIVELTVDGVVRQVEQYYEASSPTDALMMFELAYSRDSKLISLDVVEPMTDEELSTYGHIKSLVLHDVNQMDLKELSRVYKFISREILSDMNK
jgi:hypothetical protein